MKVVIIAGGKGTRIASLNSEIPKAMIPINGKPVLEYQIELAKRYGHTDIFLVIGYLGDKIRSYFGNGESFGVQIKYFEEHSPLGTAGALAELRFRSIFRSKMINFPFSRILRRFSIPTFMK